MENNVDVPHASMPGAEEQQYQIRYYPDGASVWMYAMIFVGISFVIFVMFTVVFMCKSALDMSLEHRGSGDRTTMEACHRVNCGDRRPRIALSFANFDDLEELCVKDGRYSDIRASNSSQGSAFSSSSNRNNNFLMVP